MVIKAELSSNRMVRILWITFGSISLVLGLVGIILPVLPTTPFLLIAAYCYARGSKRMHNWLLNHRWFGKYIRNYMEGKGIPRRSKIIAIAFIWITITFTALFLIKLIWLRIILFIIATAVTVYLIRFKTLKE
jgi:uncharacterized membrane protein YbaN (DUF454 family)